VATAAEGQGATRMDAAKLHAWVERYNWDDGLATMWPIADSPRTRRYLKCKSQQAQRHV